MEKKIERLVGFLKRQGYVRAAYIFGSYAEGKTGPLSDIDIAVFLDKSMSRREAESKEAFLMDRISFYLKTDNFDLVVMNRASLLLRFNIIRNGRVLKSSKERVGMEARIISDYLDRKHYDDIHTKAALERVAERGIL